MGDDSVSQSGGMPFSVLRERAGLSLRDIVSLFGITEERVVMLEQGLIKAEARHLQILRGFAIVGRQSAMAPTPRGLETVGRKRRLTGRHALGRSNLAGRVATPRQDRKNNINGAITTTPQLVSVAQALIRAEHELSQSERDLAARVAPCRDDRLLATITKVIRAGHDPLGDAFRAINAPEIRRPLGATYTPGPIIASMLQWAAEQAVPARVVDPGAGSGRFLLAAGKRFPKAHLVAIEIDPIAALMLRANLAVLGFTDRSRVIVDDYRRAELLSIAGRSLFVGNPPYVRHHDISEGWKDWFAIAARRQGVKASKLAGMHVHFFVRTLELAQDDDFGAFVTSAEWLDVNYGSALRQLLAGRLGGVALNVLDSRAMPFDDAATTGAITCFKIGRRSRHLRVKAISSLSALSSLSTGALVPWQQVAAAARWSIIVKPTKVPPSGHMELGELCRVHRGQVTGANDIWIAGPHSAALPTGLLKPAITKARELINAGESLDRTHDLRCVIDIPVDLDELDARHRAAVEAFLAWAKRQGADKGYIARHRRAWWSVELKPPAPILVTYMARRPPAFVRNLAGAHHINIAHGLYPREGLPQRVLDDLVQWLRSNVSMGQGRTYAGGLTKFEPREVERLPIPRSLTKPAEA